ncbi:hypothetical protein Hanom_Chr05g00454891 [Helianthus anomalus]
MFHRFFTVFFHQIPIEFEQFRSVIQNQEFKIQKQSKLRETQIKKQDLKVKSLVGIQKFSRLTMKTRNPSQISSFS